MRARAYIYCDLKLGESMRVPPRVNPTNHIRTSCLLPEPHRIEGTIPTDVTDDARRRGGISEPSGQLTDPTSHTPVRDKSYASKQGTVSRIIFEGRPCALLRFRHCAGR